MFLGQPFMCVALQCVKNGSFCIMARINFTKIKNKWFVPPMSRGAMFYYWS